MTDERRFMIWHPGDHPPIAGPLKIFRKERFIGTVPEFPVRSTSGIFDVRPTDFTPGFKDGEQYLEAAWNIVPGDFRCIDGFIPAGREEPASRTPLAEAFDAHEGGDDAKMRMILAMGLAGSVPRD